MKKLICWAAVLSLLATLCACNPDPGGDSQPTATRTPDPTGTTGQTVAPTDGPDVSDGTTGPAETTAPEDGSYLQEVKRRDQPVFDAPSYDGTVVGTVQEAGVYTIVEEVADDEGNLWGRLKSGMGWIDLTDVRATNEAGLLISAGWAQGEPGDECMVYRGTDSEYASVILFQAYETLRDVSFYRILWDGETYTVDEALYSLSEMNEDTPLAAYVEFAGIMTMYGVSFTDESGAQHWFRVSQNGRNNALDLTEIPAP